MAAAMLLIDNEARRALRRQRVFRDRLHPLDAYDDTELLRRYRVTRPVLTEIIDLIQDDIQPVTNRTRAVPASLQVGFTFLTHCKAPRELPSPKPCLITAETFHTVSDYSLFIGA